MLSKGTSTWLKLGAGLKKLPRLKDYVSIQVIFFQGAEMESSISTNPLLRKGEFLGPL
jgi:hypothetical protein